jgi:hypothetical protein
MGGDMGALSAQAFGYHSHVQSVGFDTPFKRLSRRPSWTILPSVSPPAAKDCGQLSLKISSMAMTSSGSPFVLVQPEMERGRSPLVRILPLGQDHCSSTHLSVSTSG